MSVRFSTEINLKSVICWQLTKDFSSAFRRIPLCSSDTYPSMSQLFNFPAGFRVLTFHLPTEMFLLPPFCYLLYTSSILFAYVPVSGGGREERWCWVNFQCRGALLIWIIVGQGPTTLAVGAGGGCLDIFTVIYPSLLCLPVFGRPHDIDWNTVLKGS